MDHATTRRVVVPAHFEPPSRLSRVPEEAAQQKSIDDNAIDNPFCKFELMNIREAACT
jgi:hypothetical protein